MNWFKLATIYDFEDRNLLNDKIDDLKKITVSLSKLAQLVFQTGSHTRASLQEILESKRLTTFPAIQKMLEEADRICLDSPHKFASLCKQAASQIILRVSKMERERKEFINKQLPNKWKGWRDRD